jgi:hypothetical protein
MRPSGVPGCTVDTLAVPIGESLKELVSTAPEQ